MIRFSQTDKGSCLFILYASCLILMMMSNDIIAKDMKSYPLPKGIVRNDGQYPSSVFGYARNGNATIWFDQSGMVIDVKAGEKGHVFRINTPSIANAKPRFEKSIFATNVMHGEKHSFKERVYSRMSLQSGNQSPLMIHEIDGQFWTWKIHSESGTSLGFSIEGADSISIDNQKGMLTLHCTLGSIAIPTPLWRQGESYVQTMVLRKEDGSLVCKRGIKYSERILNVPVLFVSFIGGTTTEKIQSLALDKEGNIYVLGETESVDYPMSSGAYTNPQAIPIDVFVAKFDSTGKNVIYSSRIGGARPEKALAITVDESGCVYATGSTTSNDFPTTNNSIQPTKQAFDEDVFVIKLSADGSQLLYGTYLTGMTTDIAHAIALDSSKHIVIAGTTGILSRNPHTFPKTVNAYDTSFNGGALDAFIAIIDPAGNGLNDLKVSTLLGGNQIDIAYAITIARNGNIIIGGETSSDSIFPVSQGALQSTLTKSSDGFIAIFSPNADSLLYSTYLGGSGYDRITSLVYDETSNTIFFAGFTNSSGIADQSDPNPVKFPVTVGAFDTTYNGGVYDGFVGKFEPLPGSMLKYSTFIGGSAEDFVTGLGVDVCSAPYLTGTTSSSDFPITDDASDSIIGKSEGFVAKLNALANVLVFSTFLGDADEDESNAIIVDGSGAIFIAGSTNASTFPGSSQSTKSKDGFLAKIQVGILPLKPVIEHIGELTFCKGDSVILDASSRNLISYEWRRNGMQIPGANSARLIVRESGIYTVDVADASGCTGSESIQVTSFERPGMTVDPVVVICTNDTTQIKVQTTDSLSVILWSPAIGLSCTDCLNPFAFPVVNTVYTLTTIDTNGCSRNDTVRVYVIDSTALLTEDVKDTITICPNRATTMLFPIRNTSVVDLQLNIISFDSPSLSAKDTVFIVPADSSILIPIEFSGVSNIGPKQYGVNFIDPCGAVKYASCMIDVQKPNFTYLLDTVSEICRTKIVEQIITIRNRNALKGMIGIISTDDRIEFSRSTLLMNPNVLDSISLRFSSDRVGLIPISLYFKHECGDIDTITWNVNVVSNPFAISWIPDSSSKKSGESFVKSFSISNQALRALDSNSTFTIGIMHEYSTLHIDSATSNDCVIQMRKVGDSTLLHYSQCKNTAELITNINFRSVIGETLTPWFSITSFSSDDSCIDPILENVHDTLNMDAYGCELTTLSIGKSTAQLLSVVVSPDNSQLHVRYDLKESMPIGVKCINAVGKISHVMQDIKDVGMHELVIPLKDMTSGVHALHFEAGQYVASSLFLILE
jgi:hypothetical protein